MRIRGWRGVALAGAMSLVASAGHAQERTAFEVSGQIAVHALMSLSDAHLQKLSDVLGLLAATGAARSGAWEQIRPHLAKAARITVPAALWYATPNGEYWTLAAGRTTVSLADRPYFPSLLAGETVTGALVVSRSTRRNTAIVAVPVRGQGGAIVGVLGSSVHLDSLAALLRQELGGLEREQLFFALGREGLGALNSDPTLIFTDPMKLGDEGMQRAFRDILAGTEGSVTYHFRGTRRTVLYRKSPVTGWWYAFGVGRR